MGSEAGQGLHDIIKRKELERQAGGGLFAWGIGNSVGPAIKYAKTSRPSAELEALFTPMKSAAKAIDVNPSSIVLWRGYEDENGCYELPPHVLVTSRGRSTSGEDKRSHYALICHSRRSLLEQEGEVAIDHHAVRNLVSSNPVGASQVTSIVSYIKAQSRAPSYPVLFRARLVESAFVRLVCPIALSGRLYQRYLEVCSSRDAEEWRSGLAALKMSAPRGLLEMQAPLF